jgi:glycosyltransferase involved in cell wall biosynthesis
VSEPAVVSVVIPCYNQAHFLHEAIESALAQTYSHCEILVVDDGSTENIAEVAAGYPKVRYIRQENSGVSAARNKGWKRSRGEYLVFLDADDRLLPEAQIGVNYLREIRRLRCRLPNSLSRKGRSSTSRNHPHVSSEHYLELLRGNYRIWCPVR